MTDKTRPNYFEDLIDDEMISAVSGGDQGAINLLNLLSQNYLLFSKRLSERICMNKYREYQPIINFIIEKTQHEENVLRFIKEDANQDDIIPSIIAALDNDCSIPDFPHTICDGRSKTELLRRIQKLLSNHEKKLDAFNVQLPGFFASRVLKELDEEIWTEPSFKWLFPSLDSDVIAVAAIENLMRGLEEWEPDKNARYKHIIENMIYICDNNEFRLFSYIATVDPNLEYNMNIKKQSFLEEGLWDSVKFDITACMPPTKIDNKIVWDKYIDKCIDLMKYKGTGLFITRTNWREPFGNFNKLKDKITSLTLNKVFLENSNESNKVFGSSYPFDWYILSNKKSNNIPTEIQFQDGSIELINLSGVELIPNSHMKEIYSLIANPGEEKVTVLHSYSAYKTVNSYMSKERIENFYYPVIYTCSSSGDINIQWSSTNKNGHFGIPKVFWSNGASSVHIDKEGKYGLTQFAYAITDSPENLENIKKALESQKFIDLMKSCVVNFPNKYNHKVIRLFRKDFWKDFI